MNSTLAKVWTWIVPVSLLIADWLIWLMLTTRSNERRIRPTKRMAWPKGLKRQLMKRQDNTCVYCGYRRTARTLDIDHMVPVVRGGSNETDNLQVICRPCNQRKGLQTDSEFRARYARLISTRKRTGPVSQAQFKAETQRTRQASNVEHFRRTRFITRREKVVSGSLLCGGAIGGLVLVGLSQVGAEGFLLLLPALVMGGAVGFGLWLRATVTGVMMEDE